MNSDPIINRELPFIIENMDDESESVKSISSDDINIVQTNHKWYSWDNLVEKCDYKSRIRYIFYVYFIIISFVFFMFLLFGTETKLINHTIYYSLCVFFALSSELILFGLAQFNNFFNHPLRLFVFTIMILLIPCAYVTCFVLNMSLYIVFIIFQFFLYSVYQCLTYPLHREFSDYHSL